MAKPKAKRLFNVRLEAYEYSLIKAAAAVRGETMARFLRRVLTAEASKILQVELNKEGSKNDKD